jgi:hypothetical protein
MNKYDIGVQSTIPQLRIFTALGPVAFNLHAYRIESDMIVSYILEGSDFVETNLGPCSIAHSVGPSFRATEIDELIKASLNILNAP